jgi:hypothetical protein
MILLLKSDLFQTTFGWTEKYIHSFGSMALRSVHFGVVGQPLDGWPKIYYLELLRASEATSSRWSWLHLKSLAPTNPSWARVGGYDPFSLCSIRKACAPAVGTLIGWWWWWWGTSRYSLECLCIPFRRYKCMILCIYHRIKIRHL